MPNYTGLIRVNKYRRLDLHEAKEILHKIISPRLVCNQMLDGMISAIFQGAVIDPNIIAILIHLIKSDIILYIAKYSI